MDIRTKRSEQGNLGPNKSVSQPHIFTEAIPCGCGVEAYLKVEDCSVILRLQQFLAKTLVTPIKGLTLQHMEPFGMHLGGRLLKPLEDSALQR
ncbi:hypothetical protein MTO96_047121 [Rhipicephalus appendiculatus]